MLTFVLALFAPLILWPIELYLPYPHIIEELAKAVLVWFVLQEDLPDESKLRQVIALGLLFAFSESVLYMMNIFALGSTSTLLTRLITTTLLHSATLIIIITPALYKKYLLPFGLILAMIVHYYYNLFI